MILPAAIEKAQAAFDRMSLRERVLIAAATLTAVVMAWTTAVMDPLTAKNKALHGEIETLQRTIQDTAQSSEQAALGSAIDVALAQETQIKGRLEEVNTRLGSESAGLIAPERMVQVIHDVLRNQHGIKLVSLQNKPVTALIEPSVAADGKQAALTGPYVHRVELVIDGRYLDIVAYLHALEALPWRFYWRSLELKTTEYPLNRVRIELCTLSLDKDWIGV